MKKKDRAYLGKVAKLGCYSCRADGRGWVQPMVHHIREGMGVGLRASDYQTIPLCEGHHQGLVDHDGTKIAFHQSAKRWRERYGSEKAIAQAIFDLIQKLDETNPGWYI